jgi:hypothetical protein
MIYESIKKGLVQVKDIYDGGATNQKEIDFWAECEVVQQEQVIRLLGKAHQVGKLERYIQILKDLLESGQK